MILYGQAVAEEIYQNLKKELSLLKGKVKPCLVAILIGENPASLSFLKAKEKAAEYLGIDFKLYHLPGLANQESLENLIKDLNQNKYIQGIVLQLPLPKDFATEKILKLITPQKDIDGFRGEYPAPTAAAILEILKFYKIGLADKTIVLVGYGRLVGQPLEKMLQKQGFQPIVCDKKTPDLKSKTLSADILISATGVPGLIKPEMVSEKVVVIDAGTSESHGRIVGDVDQEVYQKVKTYTPVPGGVGPVTVAYLMKNLVKSAKDKN